MLDFTKKEKMLIRKMNTPAKVQDFLNKLPFNFEKGGETLKSPLFSLRDGSVHCLEGALLGAWVLQEHGYRTYLLHLKASQGDYDHVIALFKKGKYWGALSKTNHSILRYREPIYKSYRELAMSYFHEYFLDNGNKTLRQYSAPLSLSVFENGWETSEGDLWGIDEELDNIKHYDFIPKSHLNKLRKADPIEIKAGKLTDF